jgi:lactate dehydrogenase-like 2-hydroxyacid dehydrogenase
VTGSNSIGVAEQEVLTLLALVRNFVPSHNYAISGGCVDESLIDLVLYTKLSIAVRHTSRPIDRGGGAGGPHAPGPRP